MTESGIDAVGVLADPLRRRLYEFVVDSGGEVSRAEAAQAVGAQRTLVAFHLDKLAAAGLLDVARRKLSGRDGPGSGRPAKLYRRADRQLSVQLPPRDYETAARVLAEAVQAHGAEEALHAAAHEEGVRRGAELRSADGGSGALPLGDLTRRLERLGYEPTPDPDDAEAVRLRNCPFHTLALDFPPLACGMNLELLRGLLEGAGAEGYTARMAPLREGCCVRISKNKSH
ncbi:putative ArsR family transcriptional regulator [Nocardiopsis mwathae]|uniref:Putative ArsR family transcriptional regulator n=1 Tax=Nocardiopsis mwathae TaxID=1472723 RepID=A0A7W9YKQ8_9ACTN|nr:helix-turn-helix domain-containing protein [Nocardiopsis mwathae]MBB6173964.1 putative ArsR family transcriptional regulator [Nocardiopsis mwathae]